MRGFRFKNNIRNVAIVAHVDHGKTTLSDAMIAYALEKQNELAGSDARIVQVEERVMDSMSIEKEKGITIGAKNFSVELPFEGEKYKINIIDTPGHSDFGSEVDRSLNNVDAVILVVDSYEGVMNQTKYVIRRAAQYDLHMIVFINKVDTQKAQPERVEAEVLEFLAGINPKYFDAPILYGSGREGTCSSKLASAMTKGDMSELFETVIKTVNKPHLMPLENPEKPIMLVTDLSVHPHLGRLLIGFVRSGSIKFGDTLTSIDQDGKKVESFKITKLFSMKVNKHEEVDIVESGDIAVIAGSESSHIYCTLGIAATPNQFGFSPLPAPYIERPSMCVTIGANISPFKGKEGKYLNVNDIRNRLIRESLSNPGIKVKQSGEVFEVYGRGELQLAVLIENMRREGFELCIGQPIILTHKDENGKILEPYHKIDILMPPEYSAEVENEMRQRGAQLIDADITSDGLNRSVYMIALKNAIGASSKISGITKGSAIIDNSFDSFGEPAESKITRTSGNLYATEEGVVTPYALDKRISKGIFFIKAGDKVFKNQIIGMGITSKSEALNVCEEKRLTNVRSAGADDKAETPRYLEVTLEFGMTFIGKGELMEATPQNIRIFSLTGMK